MHIFVRVGLGWSVTTLDVGHLDTILSIKQTISDQKSIPIWSLVIVYRGKGWNDSQTISDLNIVLCKYIKLS